MKKVVVICGCPSSEYQISIMSAQAIIDTIEYDKYSVSICIIGKDKRCCIKKIFKPLDINTLNDFSVPFNDTLTMLQKYDIALLATHGQFGEDGVLQTYLEENNIKYTGSDSYSSKLCMDKYRSSIIVNCKFNLSNIKTQCIYLKELKEKLKQTTLPVFIKPNRNGSSVCSYIIKDLQNINDVIIDFNNHHKENDEVLIQEYIKNNIEISCGCLERKDHTFIELSPIEIIPQSTNFFDYNSKYSKGGAKEIIPAIDISENLRKKISKLTVDIHKLLGCRLYSRSDFLVKNDTIYYLETNTLPGITAVSLLPKEAEEVGYPFSKLISFFIENS